MDAGSTELKISFHVWHSFLISSIIVTSIGVVIFIHAFTSLHIHINLKAHVQTPGFPQHKAVIHNYLSEPITHAFCIGVFIS